MLRPWCDADLPSFAEINADPEVMAYMPARLTRAESDDQAAYIRRHFEDHGFGMFALERLSQFIGFVGLDHVRDAMPFAPAVQIAWRLHRAHWGQSYASEAAREVLRFAFEALKLDKVVSYTTPENLRSRAVMAAIGLNRVIGGDFDHPALAEGHPLRRHVLYEAKAPHVPMSR